MRRAYYIGIGKQLHCVGKTTNVVKFKCCRYYK